MAHRFHGDRTQTRRGGRYDTRHQQARKQAAAAHHDTDPCARCHQPLGPMGPRLHYDHDEYGGYLGFSHGNCNLRAGARKGNQRQRETLGEQQRGPIPLRTCSMCGVTYQPHHPRQRCCGAACRDEQREQHPANNTTPPAPRPCAVCGTNFQPATHAIVACSPECRRQRQQQQIADWNTNHPGYHAERKRASRYAIATAPMSE